MKLKQLQEKVKNQLPPTRYEHTLGVVRTSEILAEKYHVLLESAQVAALLHDIAKYLPNNELNYSPLVWHAPVGAIVAQKSYGIIDQDVLNAIKYHTTGRPAMSTLEKIIFLADYIEPGRIQPGVDEIRNLSGQDLNRAVAKTLANTIAYLKQKSSADIHPDTMAAYEYYYDYL